MMEDGRLEVSLDNKVAKKRMWIGWVLSLGASFVLGFGMGWFLKPAEHINDQERIDAKPTVAETPVPTLAYVKDNYETKETQQIVITSKQWLKLSSSQVGLSLEYPVEKGKLSFGYMDYGDREADPAGQSYAWTFNDGDRRYSIIGGISKTFKAGRDTWFTDFYKLESGDRTGAVKVFKTRYSTEAVLTYSPLILPGEMKAEPSDKGMLIRADLPFKKAKEFSGVAIYFKDGVSLIDAQRVVDSIVVE